MNITIEIDYNKKCVRCGKPGATKSGLCLKCVAKNMNFEQSRTEVKAGVGPVAFLTPDKLGSDGASARDVTESNGRPGDARAETAGRDQHSLKGPPWD